MANTFTDIIDKIFARGLMALRQNSVMPRLVNSDWGTEVAQEGDTIDVPIPSAVTVDDVTPGPVPPAGGDSAPTKVQISLNRWRKSDMHVTDKEAREIAMGARETQLSEHLKALANDVDLYILGLYAGTGISVPGVYGFAGVAGTTPFASDLTEAIEADRLLNEQLAPIEPRRMVLSPSAKANALGNRAIQDATFRRGGEDTLRTGVIGDVLGFAWAMDQNIRTHTAGTGSGYLVNNGAGYAVGTTTIVVDTGSNTIVVGDIISFAGHAQTYVVTAATGGPPHTGLSFYPGLVAAVADNEAITKRATHVVNLAFHRDAFALATRPLAPADGFSGGHEIRTAVDPVSGLSLQLEVSREYARTKYMWSLLYGARLVRPQLACRVAG